MSNPINSIIVGEPLYSNVKLANLFLSEGLLNDWLGLIML